MKNNRIALITFLIFIPILRLYAQSDNYHINGIVKDENNDLVPGAAVILKRALDSNVISSVLSDAMGSFIFEVTKKDSFFLVIEHMSYQNYSSSSFALSKLQKDTIFPDIHLQASTNMISGITIQGRKSFIEQKIDRTVVNVDALISNAGSNALEALSKSPGVTVDEDGTINFKGKKGVMVLIDGKPTYLSATDLADYLRSLPADDINTFELMANPPAKYDAAGNAGAINIRLKKSKKEGYNGSAVISYSQGQYAKSNNSINFNYNTGKFNFFSNFNYNLNNTLQDLHLVRNYFTPIGSLNSIFKQHSLIKDKSWGAKARVGFDYYATAKSTFGIVLSGFKAGSKNIASNHAEILNPDLSLSNVVNAQAIADKSLANGTINLNYSYKPDSSSRELSFNMDYLNYSNKLESTLWNAVYLPDNTLQNESNLIGKLPLLLDIFTTNGDYTSPFVKNAKLDLGYKISYISTKNVADFYDETGNIQTVNTDFSNKFNYTENTNAAYINYSWEHKRLAVQAGLRYENTNINGHQLGDAIHPDSTFNRVFNSFFPTLYLSYKIDSASKHQLNLSYGRRIDRPNYQDMNPFTYPLDRYTLYGGNPYLLPTFSNNFELSYNYNNIITTSVLYSIVKDVISETIEQHDNTFFSQPGNIGRQHVYGISVNAGLHPFKQWQVNLYSELMHDKFTARLYDNDFKNEGTRWFLQATNQFLINDKWTAELLGSYQTKVYYAQFILIPSGMASAGIARKILKDKATLKLSVNDIFYTGRQGGKITGLSNSSAEWTNDFDSRVLRLVFSYNFNKGNTRKIRKSGSSENEQRRIGQ